MRELERTPPSPPSPRAARVAIVGPGRLGRVLAAALRGAGRTVVGPLSRDEAVPADVDLALLCVPDAAIRAAAATVAAGPLLGHTSGATGLEALGPRRAFSLHPLVPVTAHSGPAVLRGAAAAVDGSDPDALGAARSLAGALGLVPIDVAPGDRVAYHAAASLAANFLVTLEDAAERLGATAGLTREALVPLVAASTEAWARRGPRAALTGPIVRGDEATVAAQRAAVADRVPELIGMWDALADATRVLAARPDPALEAEAQPC